MNISHFFIDRPIFAAVLSIVTVILGGIAYRSLPVAQYPGRRPAHDRGAGVVPGRATAKSIADTVATPIEQEVNGVEDMLYMSSQSTNDGNMTLTITFRLGTDLDKAQVLVQNRVAIAEPRLPEDVRRIGVTTLKSSPDLLDGRAPALARQALRPALHRQLRAHPGTRRAAPRSTASATSPCSGCASTACASGSTRNGLASRNLATSDVVAALREQNIQVASGVIGQPPVPPVTPSSSR